MYWQSYYIALAIITGCIICILNKLLKNRFLWINIIIVLCLNINFFSNHFSIIKFIYSIVSNVSPTSLFYLLILSIPAKYNNNLNSSKSNIVSMSFIFIIGCILYLSTLGFIDFDIYNYGFNSNLMLLIFTITCIITIINNVIIGYIWTLCAVFFLYKLTPSNNLWDYMLDPLLWLYSFCFLIIKIGRKSSLSLAR
jgi:hypothetical protein